jgi:hypothetical protein
LGRWGQQEEIVEVAATARAQQPGNPAETVLTASSGDRLEPNTVYIFAIEAGFLRPWTIYRGRFRTLPERKPNEAR